MLDQMESFPGDTLSWDLLNTGSKKNSILSNGWTRGEGGSEFDVLGKQREGQNSVECVCVGGWHQGNSCSHLLKMLFVQRVKAEAPEHPA